VKKLPRSVQQASDVVANNADFITWPAVNAESFGADARLNGTSDRKLSFLASIQEPGTGTLLYASLHDSPQTLGKAG
jgi:hypothetical protein